MGAACGIGLGGGVVLAATAAPASEPAPEETPERPATPEMSRPNWTVMWAPLRLIAGVAEFTGEYRIQDKLGVSLQLGGGPRKVKFAVPGGTVSVPGTEVEAGVQARYYLVGSFTHGMEVGAEFLYERIKFDEPLPPGILAASAGGGALGAFGGYKIATRVGFTFEGQFGYHYVVIMPPVTGMTGNGTRIGSDSRGSIYLRLNIGWTF